MEGSKDHTALQCIPERAQGSLSILEDNQEMKYNAAHLIAKIKDGNFDNIKRAISVKALTNCDGASNHLFMAMEVIYELRCLAERERPDKEAITDFANSIEEFLILLIDPLRSDEHEDKWDIFSQEINTIMDQAIAWDQKKFLVHPVIDTEMTVKWYGPYSSVSPCTWLFVTICCVFDAVFFPLLFTISSFRQESKEKYKEHFTTPYCIFIRDTVSYLTLLGLHMAICLASSSIEFSAIEWAILIFFIGRLLVEGKQITASNVKVYLSDRWNRLDFLTLLVYLIVLILRIVSWSASAPVANNRALAIAAYFYGLNTMLLTFRAIGQLMETSKGIGIIQIALFNIVGDIGAIIGQFIAVIWAFSVAITKVYVAEKSFISGNDSAAVTQPACPSPGISCWWMIITHLGWSLLGAADLETLNSVDSSSVGLAHALYAVFLIMGVILLVNMLIALLSNTYQKVQDNSLKEWSFKKAVTIRTYSNYHPIPVPFNIISILVLGLWNMKCSKDEEDTENPLPMFMIVKDLEEEYMSTYGYSFPLTDEKKLDKVIFETENNRQIIGQIAQRTFAAGGCDETSLHAGPQAWKKSLGIRVEGCLLICDGADSCEECGKEIRDLHIYGARYYHRFSPEFPTFEVFIHINSGDPGYMGVGVVGEDHGTHLMPGHSWGTVGYHCDDQKIFVGDKDNGKDTEGYKAFPGDVIGCTVKFEEAQNGKVPVVFNVNGRVITLKDTSGMTCEEWVECSHTRDLFPYIGIDKRGKGMRVMAKMRASGHQPAVNRQTSLRDEVENIKSRVENMHEKLDLILAMLREKQ